MELPSHALWDAFQDGQRFRTDTGEAVTARIVDAGPLVLPTGRIVVSDPILDPFNQPFSVTVPPESYPVLLSLIRDEVGLVMVSFAEDMPVRWQAAEPATFAVDSTLACLMDYQVNRYLRRQAEADNYEKFAHKFQKSLDENGLWGSCCLNRESGANVIVFRSFGGDGTFPAFFGYNAAGDVVCLVIDMFLNWKFVVGAAD